MTNIRLEPYFPKISGLHKLIQIQLTCMQKSGTIILFLWMLYSFCLLLKFMYACMRGQKGAWRRSWAFEMWHANLPVVILPQEGNSIGFVLLWILGKEINPWEVSSTRHKSTILILIPSNAGQSYIFFELLYKSNSRCFSV